MKEKHKNGCNILIMIFTNVKKYVYTKKCLKQRRQALTPPSSQPNFNWLSLSLMDGLKAATPLSTLNSVRDFSASGHASANFKNKYCCVIWNAWAKITTTNSILKS